MIGGEREREREKERERERFHPTSKDDKHPRDFIEGGAARLCPTQN